MIAFTNPGFKNCIMVLDRKAGEIVKFRDDRLDFSKTKTLLVKSVMYVFKATYPVSAYKIANFTCSERLVKTTLSNLPINQKLEWFSICYWASGDSIVLTGGRDESNVVST